MWQSVLSFVQAAAVATGLSSPSEAPTAPSVDAEISASAESTAKVRSVVVAPLSQPNLAPSEKAPEPVKLAAGGEKTKAELERVVGAMQKTYESTNDFRADFTQRFTYTVLRRTQESTGTVRFKKPGRMRWDYTKPVPKQFVVDGSSLWIHTPSDKTAIVNKCFKQDGLTASVSFLWGAGNITKDFTPSWFPGQFGKKSDHHIQLLPKTPNSVFAKLILVLDPKTYRVKQSVVVDTQGNVNQFIYKNLKFNTGLKEGAFAFTPPKETHVSPMPGSCAEKEAAKAPK